MRALVTRFLSLILLATSVGVMLILMFLGYEVAIMLMERGTIAGNSSLVVLAGFPSLFALGSLPFWLVLRHMSQPAETE